MKNPDIKRLITPLPASLVEAIDDFRFTTRQPSRAAAIRLLIERGLKAEVPPSAPAKAPRAKR